MIEVADILRRHGPQYRQQHPLLPSQQKVLEDLVRCRTAACGGQLYRWDQCAQEHYSYHSCGIRHCPKCHRQQPERCLEQQQARLLPCAYSLLTFTLPQGCGPWPGRTRKSFTVCCSKVRRGPCKDWLGTPNTSAANWPCWRCCTPGRGRCFIIRTFICWSAPADSPRMANTGWRPAIPPSWSRALPWAKSFAASYAPGSRSWAGSTKCPHRSGKTTGSFTASTPARDRRCLITWAATCSGSRSPTAASNASKRAR